MPIAGKIYYFASRQGSNNGSAVILIHGAGGTHLHWPYNLRRLNGHRVLAPDLPGHGKSNGIGEQDIDKYAHGLVSWMQEVGVKKAAVIGHSMGGAIAQSIAINYPQLVERLVLISTGAVLPVNQDLLEKVSSPTTAPAALDLITKWSYSPQASPKLLKKAREQMGEIRPSVIYGDFLACNQFDSTKELSNIGAPTLILCGEEDKMTPLRFSKQLEASIPNARLTTIPSAGHMVMLEQPEIVSKMVFDFLQ